MCNRVSFKLLLGIALLVFENFGSSPRLAIYSMKKKNQKKANKTFSIEHEEISYSTLVLMLSLPENDFET